MTPSAWFYFWVACFVAATTAFAVIWVLVFIRGFADLKAMLHGFRDQS